jgi:hypothetical protein
MADRGLQIGGGSGSGAWRSGVAAAAIQQAGEVQVRFPERVVEDERLSVGGDGLVASPLIFEDDAEIEPRQRRRLGGERLAIVMLGGRQLAPLMEEAPEVVVGVGEARTSGEGAAVGGHRPGWIALFELETAGEPGGGTDGAQGTATPLQT